MLPEAKGGSSRAYLRVGCGWLVPPGWLVSTSVDLEPLGEVCIGSAIVALPTCRYLKYYHYWQKYV